MPKKAARAVVSVVIVFGALALLLFMTMSQGAQPYKHVDEVAVNPQAWYGKTFQLHGKVTGDVQVIPATLDYKFVVEHEGKQIPATYKGIVPDTFKTGAEVVLTGRLDPHGFSVEPNGVLAKCPSKYEAAGPAVKGN